MEEVTALAKACVQLRAEDRPTMRQVELTLEGLLVPKKSMLDNVSAKEFERNGILIYVSWENMSVLRAQRLLAVGSDF